MHGLPMKAKSSSRDAYKSYEPHNRTSEGEENPDHVSIGSNSVGSIAAQEEAETSDDTSYSIDSDILVQDHLMDIDARSSDDEVAHMDNITEEKKPIEELNSELSSENTDDLGFLTMSDNKEHGNSEYKLDDGENKEITANMERTNYMKNMETLVLGIKELSVDVDLDEISEDISTSSPRYDELMQKRRKSDGLTQKVVDMLTRRRNAALKRMKLNDEKNKNKQDNKNGIEGKKKKGNEVMSLDEYMKQYLAQMNKFRSSRFYSKPLSGKSSTRQSIYFDDNAAPFIEECLVRVNKWSFNVFKFDFYTQGHGLVILGEHLFQAHDFYRHFNLNATSVHKMFKLIEAGYLTTNVYHNLIHAIDVTQAMHCFLIQPMLNEMLSPMEKLVSILAAACHDLYHPGVSQPFLDSSKNYLMKFYEGESVLENHHWQSAVGCLVDSGVNNDLGKELMEEVTRKMKLLILATDISQQSKYLTEFKEMAENLNRITEDTRLCIMQMALKCADISNPCRPWSISKTWSIKVCREFFMQGDYETGLSWVITNVCDRTSFTIPSIQLGFLSMVVKPLFETWNEFLITTMTRHIVNHINANFSHWQDLAMAAKKREELNSQAMTAVLANEPPMAKRKRGYSLPAVLQDVLEKSPLVRRNTLPSVTQPYDEFLVLRKLLQENLHPQSVFELVSRLRRLKGEIDDDTEEEYCLRNTNPYGSIETLEDFERLTVGNYRDMPEVNLTLLCPFKTAQRITGLFVKRKPTSVLKRPVLTRQHSFPGPEVLPMSLIDDHLIQTDLFNSETSIENNNENIYFEEQEDQLSKKGLGCDGESAGHFSLVEPWNLPGTSSSFTMIEKKFDTGIEKLSQIEKQQSSSSGAGECYQMLLATRVTGTKASDEKQPLFSRQGLCFMSRNDQIATIQLLCNEFRRGSAPTAHVNVTPTVPIQRRYSSPHMKELEEARARQESGTSFFRERTETSA